MTRGRWWVVLAIGLGCVAVAAAASWSLGRQRALESLSFVDVSAGDAAQAMQDDHFFSDYGGKILVVHGPVASVHATGSGYTVSMGTGTSFGLTCTITSPAGVGQPATGPVITMVAPGGTAQREPSSVDLPDCRIMNDH
ncbi:MAG TPA: hypothetical protein VIJ41_15790 [Candidatus Nanopelagicales bacterium]|jgi:hypothetical protein